MILNLLTFFIGFIMIIMIITIILGHKKEKQLNIFFLILLGIAGVQRFVHALGVFDIIDSTNNPFETNQILAFFIPPIYYLFFDNLLFKRTPFKKVMLHILFPIVTLIVFKGIFYDKIIAHSLFFIFSTTYVILSIILLKKHLFNRKNYKELLHFQSIRIWSLIMLIVFFLLYLTVNYLFFIRANTIEFNVLSEFYSITSIIWFFIIIYIMKNPVILYGEQLLIEVINKSKRDELEVWRKNKKKQTDEDDQDLEKKVKGSVEEIIFSINKTESELLNDFIALPALKEYASRLDYPQSHIKYVFKYYSYYSFSEYQNILKVKYAIRLMKSGYLDTKTIDSLAIKCLYTNRFTFFKNFKKFTGFSPTEYQILLSK